MKVLLDTHIFIWWDSEPEKLSPNILSLLQRTDIKLYYMSVLLVCGKYKLRVS